MKNGIGLSAGPTMQTLGSTSSFDSRNKEGSRGSKGEEGWLREQGGKQNNSKVKERRFEEEVV
eukprot:1143378-Pelagomonas_calceolata.AAC.3